MFNWRRVVWHCQVCDRQTWKNGSCILEIHRHFITYGGKCSFQIKDLIDVLDLILVSGWRTQKNQHWVDGYCQCAKQYIIISILNKSIRLRKSFRSLVGIVAQLYCLCGQLHKMISFLVCFFWSLLKPLQRLGTLEQLLIFVVMKTADGLSGFYPFYYSYFEF